MIAAEGEQKASKSLREASEIIAQSPSALQLRYLQVRMHLMITSLHREGLSVDPPRSVGLVLSVGRCESNSNSLRNVHDRPSGTDRVIHPCSISQTLNSISAEKNSTIIFPLPIDFISHFLNRGRGGDTGGGSRGHSGTSSPTTSEARGAIQ